MGGGLDALTARQRQVLHARCAEGRTNIEIADMLFISRQTVKNHVLRIKQRLGLEGQHTYRLCFELGRLYCEHERRPEQV